MGMKLHEVNMPMHPVDWRLAKSWCAERFSSDDDRWISGAVWRRDQHGRIETQWRFLDQEDAVMFRLVWG
jgi:hypothetical protein